jgi:hypothetical protein
MCTYAGDFMKSRIEGLWDDIKTLQSQTRTKNNVWEGRGTAASNTTSLQLTQAKGGQSLSLMGPNLDGQIQDYSYRPEKYIDAPTRMIREALISLLTSIAAHVTIREELFDEIVDMLDPVLDSRSNVRKALESRNPDAVWLRIYKKSRSAGARSGSESAQATGLYDSFAKLKTPGEKSHWRFVRV